MFFGIPHIKCPYLADDHLETLQDNPRLSSKIESLEQPVVFQLIRNGPLLMQDFGSSVVEMTKVPEMSKMSEITLGLVLLKINHNKHVLYFFLSHPQRLGPLRKAI